MTWTLQMHGLTDHLPADEARRVEESLVVKAHGLFAELVPAGHQGVAGTVNGEHVGQINLVDATAPPEGTPEPGSGELADGSPEPAPTEPPPAYVNGEAVEPGAEAPSPPTTPQ